MIFITPSHQFPTGVVLPINRRIELIKYARENDIYIVEDDYDSEFRFEGSPIESMQSLDPDHVIYVGTFSKIFMPSLRMGYIVLPDNILNKTRDIKYVADLHSPILEQLTMAEFIKQGLLDKHIKKMRNLYLKKRNQIIKCLKHYFEDEVSISGMQAGMHFIGTFKGIHFNTATMNKIYDAGIEITPLRKYYVQNEYEENLNSFISQSLVFGYGNTDVDKIENGIVNLY
ncbi:PLP-dependent aminotransferase family protein, partial [uncultured Clostridium sp.]|uniref:aminotransferase-like domain-containing protein n=1 Tax=uncultured Clostridium sp. TaxID=59620 RepID=UPI0025F6C158